MTPAGLLLRGALVLVLAGGALGCGGDDAKERREAVRRIDALRDAAGASVADRRALLAALKGVPGGQSAVADARDRCVAAYTDLVDATEIEESARAAMATGEKVDTIVLADRLDRASRLLERSRLNMPGCDEAAAALRIADR